MLICFKKKDGSPYPKWEEKKLGDVLSIPQKEEADVTNTSQLITVKLNLGGIIVNKNTNLKLGATKYYIRHAGQFIYGIQNFHNGAMGIIPVEFEGKATSSFVPSLNIHDINPQYLIAFISREEYYKNKERYAKGTGSKLITENILINFEIYLPCLEEQQRIADYLSKIDEKIETQEKIIADYEEQKKWLMQKIFSQEIRFKRDDGTDYPEWEEKKLGEICKIIMGQSPSGDSVNENGDGIPLIQGKADITTYGIKPLRCTTKPTKICEATDIVMTVRAPVGYVVRLGFKACLGRGVCAIRTNNTNDFLYFMLQYKELEWRKIEQGSTFTAVNSDDIFKLNICVPCLEEQQKIADFLSAMDRKIEAKKKILDDWKEFKRAMLQELFKEEEK